MKGDVNFYEWVFFTQSQNGSSKTALLIQSLALDHFNSHSKTPRNWRKLKDFSFQTTQIGFAFFKNNFFHEITDNTVQQMTSAGILQRMIEMEIGRENKFDINTDPEKLNIEQLCFGFFIWLGFCGISLATFVLELFVWMLVRIIKQQMRKSKTVKLKFAKIHPV